MRRILLGCLVVAAALIAPAGATAAAPTVTLVSPANGGLITGGQPSFSGTAGNAPTYSGTVAVSVYAGTDDSGIPVQVLTAAVSSGSYKVSSTGLADGTYTAVAAETDTTGNIGSSDPSTFQLFNGTAGDTLTAPPSPITTPAPTFTGTAQTAAGDSSTVDLTIYPGASTNATPLEVASGTASGGGFTIQVTPGLANGTYTAVASQDLASGTTFSSAVQFTIGTTAPALTVTSPAASASEPQTGVVFTGAAGDNYGDDADLSLTLYAGAKAAGTPIGTASVARNGASWSETWATTLALGTYTLVVSQGNLADETTTITRTFTVAAPGSITGAVSISKTGKVSASLDCLTGAGTCNGDVLIVTTATFQPERGGPRGPLRLMFDHYSVGAGTTATLTAKLTALQLRAVRRAGGAKLKVTVMYGVGATLTESSQTTGMVKVG